MKLTPRPQGFIALMSAIIISAVLLITIVAGSLTSFYARFNALDAEYKVRSSTLADACVDEALLKLASDTSYAGSENFSVGSDTCKVGPISGATQKSFETQSIFQHSYTNLQVVVNASDLSVVSWQEVPTF